MDNNNRIIRIEDKIDTVINRISGLEVIAARQAGTLESQHESLKEHIRRTNLLEDDVKPLKRRYEAVNLILKGVGSIAVIASILEGVTVFLEYIRH